MAMSWGRSPTSRNGTRQHARRPDIARRDATAAETPSRTRRPTIVPPAPSRALRRDRPGVNDHPDPHDPAAEMVGGRNWIRSSTTNRRARPQARAQEASRRRHQSRRADRGGRKERRRGGPARHPPKMTIRDRQPLLAPQAAERGDDERPRGRADPAARQQHAVTVHPRLDDRPRVGRHHRLVAHADEAEKRHQRELGENPPVVPQVAQPAQKLFERECFAARGSRARASRIDRTAAIAAT